MMSEWAGVLADHGFSVGGRERSTLTLEEVEADLLRHLAPDEQQGFFFARYKDEILDAKKDGLHWECFGTTPVGLLLADQAGVIRLLMTLDDCFDGATVGMTVYVNQDMTSFVESYSRYMSHIFALRSLVASDEFHAALGHFEEAVLAAVFESDPAGVDGNAYWPVQAYMVGDNYTFAVTSAHQLAAAGRFCLFGERPAPSPPGEQRWRTDRRPLSA